MSVLEELKKIHSSQPTAPAAILLAIRARLEKSWGIENRIGKAFKGSRGVIFVGKAGVGKAQPNYAKVLTPLGWKTMGSIKSGDIVCCPDGKNVKVLDTFPQGKMDIYRITFSDGQTVDCTGDHLWCVNDRKKQYDGKTKTIRDINKEKYKNRILTTFDIIEGINGHQGDKRFSINTIDYCEFNYKDVPIDPYLLGCLIGDGHLIKTPCISNPEKEIIDKIQSRLIDKYYLSEQNKNDDRCPAYYITHGIRGLKNYYSESIAKLGLNKKSQDKFIPRDYLFNSKEIRYEILRGLMDTDGTVNHNGTTSFCTVSKQLSEDIAVLIKSLGGLVTISKKQPQYTYRGKRRNGQIAYDCYIRFNSPKNLFHLSRKKNAAKKRTKYFTKRVIRKIEKVDNKESKCILIDHPDHLYITDGFVKTHNTTLLRSIYEGLEFDRIHFTADGPVGPNGRWLPSTGGGSGVGVYQTLEDYNDSIIFADELSLDTTMHIHVLKQIAHGELCRPRHNNIEPVPFSGLLIGATNAIGLKSKDQMEHLVATLDRFMIIRSKSPGRSVCDIFSQVFEEKQSPRPNWELISEALDRRRIYCLTEGEKLWAASIWDEKCREILDPSRINAQFRNAIAFKDILWFCKRFFNCPDLMKDVVIRDFAVQMISDCILFNPIGILNLTPLEEVIHSVCKDPCDLATILRAVSNAGVNTTRQKMQKTLQKMSEGHLIVRNPDGNYCTKRLV